MQFQLTMMCGACKWKITNALKEHGYQNFNIDMNNSILTFYEDVNSYEVIKVVNSIGYEIHLVQHNPLFDD